MDILILIISLFLLFKGRIDWVLFLLVFLTSSYLNAGTGASDFPVEHNVSLGFDFIRYTFLLFIKKK